MKTNQKNLESKEFFFKVGIMKRTNTNILKAYPISNLLMGQTSWNITHIIKPQSNMTPQIKSHKIDIFCKNTNYTFVLLSYHFRGVIFFKLNFCLNIIEVHSIPDLMICKT